MARGSEVSFAPGTCANVSSVTPGVCLCVICCVCLCVIVCGFTYHKKCLSLVDRICSACSSHSSMDDSHAYILEVCPERGLTRQHFRCGRCNVGLINTATLTRLCDYCGQYFCPNCHRNDEAVIPARVIHNWDFTSKKVCHHYRAAVVGKGSVLVVDHCILQLAAANGVGEGCDC